MSVCKSFACSTRCNYSTIKKKTDRKSNWNDVLCRLISCEPHGPTFYAFVIIEQLFDSGILEILDQIGRFKADWIEINA